MVFADGKTIYNPILEPDKTTKQFVRKAAKSNSKISGNLGDNYQINVGYPKSILKFMRPNNLTGGGLHPTQKPVKLFEYLIKTYTNPGETVLDNTIGSGTTAVASFNTNRKWIGIEKDKDIYQSAVARIKKDTAQLQLF